MIRRCVTILGYALLAVLFAAGGLVMSMWMYLQVAP